MIKNILSPGKVRIYLSALALVFLWSIYNISLSLNKSGTGTAFFLTLVIALITIAVLVLLKRDGIINTPLNALLVFLPLCATLLIRLPLLDYITLDYKNFLSPWVEHIRTHGGLSSLKNPVGNYNIPYLMFLSVISYLPFYDLYLIKLFSILFDFVIAIYLMRIVSCFTESKAKRLICFFLALILPTPVLNGALWGQCDSVYAGFAVMSIYYGLKNKSAASVACIALSFAFKLQAIFIIPLFILFLFSNKIRVRHLLVFPAVYFVAVMPAIIAGHPVIGTLTIYFSELGTVGSGLNYNSPSVYSLFRNISNPELASKLGILAAFTLCLLIVILAFFRRKHLTDKSLLLAALLFAAGIPMLLPHMHDRYFFIADILALAVAILIPKLAYTAPLVFFSSLLGYHAYLKMRYLLPMSYGFYALSVVLISIIIAYISSLSKSDIN